MTGRDSLSVLRSLQRFLGIALPAPWNIEPVRREPQVRPLAVIRFIGPELSSGTAYVRRYVQPVEVLIYPTGIDGNPYASQMEAEGIKHAVVRAIDTGLTEAGSYSMRVPLFDYTDVGLDEALPPDRVPIDYLVLSDLDASALPDPDQDDLFTITVDFRVLFSDDGDRRRFQGPTLEDITVGYVPPRVILP